MAFTGINSFTAIGPQSVFWAKALNGLPYGSTGAIAAGASAGMARWDGIKSIEVTEPDAETLTPTGNNGALDPYVLQPNAAPTGTLTTSVRDQVNYTASNGLKIATTGTRDLMGLIPACYNYSQIQMLVNSPAKSTETATIGEDGFVVNGMMSVRNNSKAFTTMTERAVRDWTNNLVFSRSSKTLWGEAWTTAAHNGTKFVGFEFSSPYPIHIITFIGNGTAGVTASPITFSETLAEDSAANVQVWRAGVQLVYDTDYTVDTTTNTIEFAVAPTNGSINIIVYGFVPIC